MIFNDDSMLDYRGNGFGDGILDGVFGFDVGEVVVTGRVPGALYVDDFSDGEYGLQHIQPLEFAQDELNTVSVDVFEAVDSDEALVAAEEAPAGLVAANDDEAPAALAAPAHGKDAEPLVLIQGDDDAGDGELILVTDDLQDLAIPPIPPRTFEAPTVTVTGPTFDDEPAPVIIGGRAYQSLAFLILDTPFVVGDSQLPAVLRPGLSELLGLATDDDDGQAFVLPVGGKSAWRLG